MKRVVIALVLAAATGSSAAQPPPSAPMAGFARYESNKWLFRSCNARDPSSDVRQAGVPFIDATPGGVLSQAIQERWRQSADPLRGVFVEISGYTEQGRVTVTQLHRALGWVESCSARPSNVPPGARAWAAGNEPSWSFVLEADSAAVRAVDGVLRLPVGSWKVLGSTAVYEAATAGGRVRVEFTDAACSDTMAEATFGRRAVAAVNGAFMTGCGLVR